MTRQPERTRGFAGDEGGGVTIMFALLIVVLLVSAGLAVDYARVLHTRASLVWAADAAALAAGRALSEGTRTDAEIRELARAFFRANAGNATDFGDVGALRVDIDREAGTVTVDVDADVAMTLGHFAGIDSMTVPAMAATMSSQRDIELSLVLDVTGSMQGSKIAALRTAAADLVDFMLPDAGRPGAVRIALAPYAASVNAGSYFQSATGLRGSSGCVYERGGSNRFTDSAPGGGSYLGSRSGLSCPSATVQPLSENKASLQRAISRLSASGMTAGHVGTAWGWYLLSPRWSSVWPNDSRPAAYDPNKTIKAVLLMTDGEFNQPYVHANGDSAAQARALCTNMKREGVVVYSVAFDTGRAAERLLAACASSPSHYFEAQDGEALKNAFMAIGRNLAGLHLTH